MFCLQSVQAGKGGGESFFDAISSFHWTSAWLTLSVVPKRLVCGACREGCWAGVVAILSELRWIEPDWFLNCTLETVHHSPSDRIRLALLLTHRGCLGGLCVCVCVLLFWVYCIQICIFCVCVSVYYLYPGTWCVLVCIVCVCVEMCDDLTACFLHPQCLCDVWWVDADRYIAEGCLHILNIWNHWDGRKILSASPFAVSLVCWVLFPNVSVCILGVYLNSNTYI